MAKKVIFEVTSGKEYEITDPGQIDAFKRTMLAYGNDRTAMNETAAASRKFLVGTKCFMAAHVINFDPDVPLGNDGEGGIRRPDGRKAVDPQNGRPHNPWGRYGRNGKIK